MYMRTLDTIDGYKIIFDNDDYKVACKFKWHVREKGNHKRPYIAGTNMQASVFVFGSGKEGYVIDHINGDTFDNRKKNLRLATYSENGQNRKKKLNTSSRFIGVTFDRDKKLYVGKLAKTGKTVWKKYFHSEVEAARAYNIEARKIYGDNAAQNIVPTAYQYEIW